MLAIIIILIILLGYLWSYPFQKTNNVIIVLGQSFFWGIVLFINFSLLFKSFSICQVFIFAFLFSGCFSFILSRFLIDQIHQPGISFSRTEISAILAVFGVYLLIYGRLTTLDPILHFFNAEQIKIGLIPPSTIGFPLITLKYHYGYDFLLGYFKRYTSINYATLSSILTLLLIFSSITIASSYFKKRNFTNILFALALGLVFLGGGFFVLSKYFIAKETSSGLALSSLFGQSSWVFGVTILFLVLDFFNDFKWSALRNALVRSIFLMPVLLAIGVLTGSGYVLILLAFFTFLLHISVNLRENGTLITAFYTVAYFIIFYMTSQTLGGLLIKGEYYDKPAYVLAPFNIDLKIYSVRIIAYIFALAPIGLYSFVFLVNKYLKQPLLYFKVAIHDLFINTVTLGLFCFPIFIWIENGYWDSFCKFNVYGILTSWIIFSDVTIRNLLRKRSMTYILITVILMILSINESLFAINRSVRSENVHKSYPGLLERNDELLNSVRNNVPINNRIYLINREVTGMFEIDRATNKANVNLYHYINENFGDLSVIALETGRSVANFYFYNFLIDRSLEYELWGNIDNLLKGNKDVLSQIKGEYIISSISKLPDFAKLWYEDGFIELVDKSEQFNWIIYRVR